MGANGYELILDIPHQTLVIEYGSGEFDACGALFAHPTSVAGVHALILTQGGYTQLVWPATPADPTGVYGLNGPYSPARMLAFARSMPRPAGDGSPSDC